MTNIQLDVVRQRLLKMKQQLQPELDVLGVTVCFEEGDESVDNLSNVPVEDRAERGSADYNEIVGIGLLNHARSRLEEVVDAIPFARQCIECAHFTEPKNDVSPGNL